MKKITRLTATLLMFALFLFALTGCGEISNDNTELQNQIEALQSEIELLKQANTIGDKGPQGDKGLRGDRGEMAIKVL